MIVRQSNGQTGVLLPESNVFPLKIDDGRTAEELIEAGQYDWVSYYAQQIVRSKVDPVTTGERVDVVLVAPNQGTFTNEVETFRRLGYDAPQVRDALRFGEQHPSEQCKAPIIFLHTPWEGPHRRSFVLVLRAVKGERELSYCDSINNWWYGEGARFAARRRNQ
jgi:hypothetical protein